MSILSGILLGLRRSGPHLWRCYIVTTIGEILVLCFIYAVHRVILTTGVSIPASVVCMIILFAALLVLEKVAGTRRTARVVRFIDGVNLLQDAPVIVAAPEPARTLAAGQPAQRGLPTTDAIELRSMNQPTAEELPPPKVAGFFVRVKKHLVFGGPVGFSLRWINVCFTPAFVALPLSDRVSAAEALEIAGVFVFGYLISLAITVYFVWGLQRVIGKPRRSYMEDAAAESNDDESDGSMTRDEPSQRQRQVLDEPANPESLSENTQGRARVAVNKVLETLRPGKSRKIEGAASEEPEERDDEKSMSILETEDNEGPSRIESIHSVDGDLGVVAAVAYPEIEAVEHAHGDIDTIPGRRSSVGSDTGDNDVFAESVTTTTTSSEVDERKYRIAQFIARRIDWLFYGTMLVAGAAGYWASPTSYAMPAQLAILVLCFLAAMQIPHKYRVYLHPILVSAALTVLVLYLFGVVYTATISSSHAYDPETVERVVDETVAGILAPESASPPTFVGFSIRDANTNQLLPAAELRARISSAVLSHRTFGFTSLRQALWQFKTGRNYLTVFDKQVQQPLLYNPKTQAFEPALPGAGDIISTLLDTSIVALAVPMYNYRGDLKRNFWVIMIPCIVIALASFFAYPPLCYAVGIQSTRALSFVARSVTLALALPVVASLGGSSTLVAVVGILSGIVGVIIGGWLVQRVLRVRGDDYVTIGVVMGINSSAIGSAHLLATNPRASALSSLSFFVFGTTLVIMAAITPLVNVIRGWVDLQPL